MAQARTSIIWAPAPDDPFEEIMPEDVQAPPRGAIASDDPMYVDRYASEQLILSVEQVQDITWPVEAGPVIA